jgi:outer membrane protein assembly factor BamD
MRLSTFLLPAWLLLTLMLTACSDDPAKSDPFASWSAKEFYEESKRALSAGEFKTAIEHLENLEARFPFSPYARQAQLDVAYAYYKFEEPDSVITAADRFLRLNPRDEHVDYAWYLKGLANFSRGAGFMDSWFPRDPAQHDSKTLKDAFNDFSTLVRRYPDSRYAADAYKRLVYLRNELAEHEVVVANYYMKRGAWLAAAQRGQYVLEHYSEAPARVQALQIMDAAYTKLSMNDLATDARHILASNPPVDAATTNVATNLDVLPPVN